MAKKKKSDSGGMTGKEWLDTYSDCVTLLMTFFVLLYSMSTVDVEKVRSISEAFSVMTGQDADSILQFNEYDGRKPVIGGETEYSGAGEYSSNQQEYENIKQYLAANNIDASIAEIVSDKRGVIIELKDSVLFDSGSANLISGSKDILNKISGLISSIPNDIIVEGHTDNIPIHNSKFSSNWELSTIRATTVVRYFTEVCNQNPSRISAAGYGEYKPVKDNTTDENRADNRRVNILIVQNSKE